MTAYAAADKATRSPTASTRTSSRGRGRTRPRPPLDVHRRRPGRRRRRRWRARLYLQVVHRPQWRACPAGEGRSQRQGQAAIPERRTNDKRTSRPPRRRCRAAEPGSRDSKRRTIGGSDEFGRPAPRADHPDYARRRASCRHPDCASRAGRSTACRAWHHARQAWSHAASSSSSAPAPPQRVTHRPAASTDASRQQVEEPALAQEAPDATAASRRQGSAGAKAGPPPPPRRSGQHRRGICGRAVVAEVAHGRAESLCRPAAEVRRRALGQDPGRAGGRSRATRALVSRRCRAARLARCRHRRLQPAQERPATAAAG